MLGELYKPTGLARETAEAVLEVEEPYAVNVALGCTNGCGFCYGPKAIRGSRETYLNMRQPKEFCPILVGKQLDKLLKEKKPLPKGVFASFLTDPFLDDNREATQELAQLTARHGIKFATLSKVGLIEGFVWQYHVRHGISLVSLDLDFWKEWTPNVLRPLQRVEALKGKQIVSNLYTWVSMEPYPPSAIWKQDITELLEAIKFVDLIVFGKWNYDKRATTPQAKQDYTENIHVLRDFCKSHNIRLHIKSDTLKFVGMEKKT